MKKTADGNQDAEAMACRRKTTIGGQALIEGLMMIGPEKKAMAIRSPDGSIKIEELPMTKFTGAANWPFVRGLIRLFRQLVSGTKALLRSAELAEEPEEANSEATEDASGSGEPQAQQKRKLSAAIDRFFQQTQRTAPVWFGNAGNTV